MASPQKRQREQLPFELQRFESAMVTSNQRYNVTSFVDLIVNEFKELPKDQNYSYWSLLKFCNSIIAAIKTALRSGIGKLPSNNGTAATEWTLEKICEKLDAIRKILRSFRLIQYDYIYSYSTSGESKRWNVVSAIYQCESYIMFIRRRLLTLYKLKGCTPAIADKYQDNFNVKTLDYLQLKQKVICYGAKIRKHLVLLTSSSSSPKSWCLTQNELYISLKTLTDRWFDIVYCDELRYYIAFLAHEFYTLVVQPDQARMDGKNDRDKMTKAVDPEDSAGSGSKTNEPQVIIICSDEFVNNIATIFTYVERGLAAMKLLFSKFKQVSDPVSIEERQAFFRWILFELQFLQKSRLIGKIKEVIFSLCIRPGESEYYMREHNGLESGDFTGVLELSKTPIQSVWWSLKLFGEGFAAFFECSDETVLRQKNFIRDIISIRMFHQFCLNDMTFNWWDHCFVHEHDFFRAEKKLFLSLNPMVILCMGHFIVFCRGEFYIYNHADQAILKWIFLVRASMKDDSIQFRTFQQGSFDLTRIYDLLEQHIKLKTRTF